jgi:endonuclease YncB( thermonuclease family)
MTLESVNELLIKEGHAVEYFGGKKIKHGKRIK